MRHLYTYTLSLPLTYYTYDLRSDDSEFILGLRETIEWEELIHIEMPYPLDDSRIYVAEERMHFCLSSHFTEYVSDDGQSSYQMPDKFFLCTISGIVAESKTKARELVDASIVKVCKALSILMSCHNCNKQGYQPRVEPDYKQQSWQSEEYLVRILHRMGVKEFRDCGTQFVIEKSTMKELTTLRNSYYHGDGKKVDGTEKHISVDLAVARLMYICEGIILYVMREGSDRREHGED